MVVITNPMRQIEWVNRAFEKTTGYSLDESRGKVPGDLLNGPDKDPATRELLHGKLASAEGCHTEILNYTKSGQPYWVSADIQPVFSDDGILLQFVAVESDITVQKAELERIKKENEVLRWIQRMSDILFFIDKIQSVWTQFRDMAIQLLGIHAGVYIVRDGLSWQIHDWFGINELDVGCVLEQIVEDAREPLASDQKHYRFVQGSDRLIMQAHTHSNPLTAEFRYDVHLDQNRHSVIYLYYAQPEATLRPIVLSLMEFFRLALQVVMQRELMKRQNAQDALTMISNRRGLETHMEYYFLARRPIPSVFLLIDLDGFKRLNDTFGHQKGDEALQAIAQHFKNTIRKEDWIARLGGDEFVMVLHDTTWNDQLIHKLQTMFVESPVHKWGLGLTMGVVTLPEEATNFQEAYRLADERMYHGKKSGKKRMIGPNNEILTL